jgi:hypothetical protein
MRKDLNLNFKGANLDASKETGSISKRRELLFHISFLCVWNFVVHVQVQTQIAVT